MHWFEELETRHLEVNGARIFARVSRGAQGPRPALLLLHGFPQSHVMWHRVATRLQQDFYLVLPDLPGYGDSSKAPGLPDHSNYSKRTMARDMVAVMDALGVDRFFLCGHDRGGRVAHRLALDHPARVQKLCVLDIAPTLDVYAATDFEFAKAYYHWFHLIQPAPLPETMIGGKPLAYLHAKLGGWGSTSMDYIEPAALAEYERCFVQTETIHAMCEDYRAAASIDLEHDRADAQARIACPLRVLWGERGVVHRLFSPIADWQTKASGTVTGRATPGGHYIAEETPELLADEMLSFFGQR